MNPSESNPGTDASGARSAMGVAAMAMAMMAETRDSDSGKHVFRVQHYVGALARKLREQPRFAAQLSDSYIEALLRAVPLYDMGTIGIPDRVLLKPARLDAAEFELMKTHTTLARDALDLAAMVLMGSADSLQMVRDLVYCHHEKWDGSGYPQGLAGAHIPMAARLLALADVYDALITDRVYKSGVSHEEAVGTVFQGRDSHFDPDLVDAFMEIADEFNAIARRHADTALDMQKKIDYLADALAEDAAPSKR